MMHSMRDGLGRRRIGGPTVVLGPRRRHATKVPAWRAGGPAGQSWQVPPTLMRYGLATGLLPLAFARPAVAQEIRPTLDRIKETGDPPRPSRDVPPVFV